MSRKSLIEIRAQLQVYIKKHTGRGPDSYRNGSDDHHYWDRYEEANYTLAVYQDILGDLNGGIEYYWKNGEWWPKCDRSGTIRFHWPAKKE